MEYLEDRQSSADEDITNCVEDQDIDQSNQNITSIEEQRDLQAAFLSDDVPFGNSSIDNVGNGYAQFATLNVTSSLNDLHIIQHVETGEFKIKNLS
ncbi:unnamed protein product [Rotaria sp. Silwood2]|nr:unnamed protein product [Rotaria sp. Silwood2]CAF3065039.1 unnamed protein product [Rotaria sp. Silwood2]CAF3423193.1 unnamed protein product [Rotaria sp. Silwood2]CAF4387239.1 unnamed protein product [Rotaria sp. Silwood2]CAF4473489.1 unnamed protein product [Rotaria sp. Silwood2]